jgi:transposase
MLTDLIAADLPHLLALVPCADLYLQDEVEIALHPTLTRVWCPQGRRGQRAVQTPGINPKRYGFGAVDWRDGGIDWALAEGRRAAPFCDQLRRLVARSAARKRVAMVLLDNLSIHTPKGSKLLRALLAELGERLVLVYTPTYDPDSNRIEWLWRALRGRVTHNHQRTTLDQLVSDADAWVHDLTADQILAQIGSPFADTSEPQEDLDHAA